MSLDSTQRYIDQRFTCIRCNKVNETRIDRLKDLYHKGKNPPIQDGHRWLFYYNRNCKYCDAYNEVVWRDSSGH